MNIIGLGKAGCKIAELFKEYPQYTVFKIDSDEKLKRKKNCKSSRRQHQGNRNNESIHIIQIIKTGRKKLVSIE